MKQAHFCRVVGAPSALPLLVWKEVTGENDEIETRKGPTLTVCLYYCKPNLRNAASASARASSCLAVACCCAAAGAPAG